MCTEYHIFVVCERLYKKRASNNRYSSNNKVSAIVRLRRKGASQTLIPHVLDAYYCIRHTDINIVSKHFLKRHIVVLITGAPKSQRDIFLINRYIADSVTLVF